MLALVAAWTLGFPPNAEAPEKDFLQAREKLTSGQMTIDIEVEAERYQPNKRHWQKTIWYTPDRYRCDSTELDKPKTRREVFGENCERESYYVYFDESRLDPAAGMFPLVLRSMKLPAGASFYGRMLKFDPRIVGAGAFSFGSYHAVTLKAIVDRADRSPPEVEETTWKTHPALVVSYQRKSGTKIRQTFVPSMGSSLVRYELETVPGQSPDGKLTRLVMDAEVAPHGKERVWFPTQVLFLHHVNGKLTERNLLRFSDVSFGSVAPDVFTLAGMQIPAGSLMQITSPDEPIGAAQPVLGRQTHRPRTLAAIGRPGHLPRLPGGHRDARRGRAAVPRVPGRGGRVHRRGARPEPRPDAGAGVGAVREGAGAVVVLAEDVSRFSRAHF